MNFINILKLIRPHQYIKNFFILLPLFFAAKITDADLLFQAVMAFTAFSMTTSAIYVLNDYHDIEEDRQHPKKRYRPLASGAISKPQAVFLILTLFATGLPLMTWLSFVAAAILLVYVILNIGYSFCIKNIAILDVIAISTGFVLRLFTGSAVTGIPLSEWIVVMTFLLALFMALAKRRDDVLIFLETGQKMRKVVSGYNLQFLDTAMAIMAAVVIVAYCIYTTSPEVVGRFHTNHLYMTAPFVIIGILRYLQIAIVYRDSGSPTQIVLKDRFMQMTIAGWITSFAWILYL